MKEAIIVDLEGYMKDVTLVADDVAGVFPIYESSTVIDANDVEHNPNAVGYQVAIRVPEGLYKPKWDFLNEKWVEGLSQMELDKIRSLPTSPKVKRKFKLLQRAADTNIELVTAEVAMQARINAGEVTVENFEQLSQEEQNIVKGLLSKQYSQKVTYPKALLAVEFTLAALKKLLGKAIDRVRVT